MPHARVHPLAGVAPPTGNNPAMPSIAQLEKLLDDSAPDPFVLYGLAQEYSKLRDFPRAFEYYDRCLSVDPDYCYAYYHKARAQANAGDTAAALLTITAGIAAAKRAGDGHAASELQGLRAELD